MKKFLGGTIGCFFFQGKLWKGGGGAGRDCWEGLLEGQPTERRRTCEAVTNLVSTMFRTVPCAAHPILLIPSLPRLVFSVYSRPLHEQQPERSRRLQQLEGRRRRKVLFISFFFFPVPVNTKQHNNTTDEDSSSNNSPVMSPGGGSLSVSTGGSTGTIKSDDDLANLPLQSTSACSRLHSTIAFVLCADSKTSVGGSMSSSTTQTPTVLSPIDVWMWMLAWICCKP